MTKKTSDTLPSFFDPAPLVQDIADIARAGGWRVMTAESCTGGMAAAALTAVPGASQWFDGGIVCYSNAMKQRLLQVPPDVLDKHGAVSKETAHALCEGLRRLGADYGVSITGIAGPGGGSEAKPVGTIWYGLLAPDGIVTATRDSLGNRQQVRRSATRFAVELLRAALRRTTY